LFVAILPLSILSTALLAGRGFGDQIVYRFRLTGTGADAAHALFAAPSQVQSAAGLLGLLILVVSVLSFARALERVYLDCWGLTPVRAAVRGRLVWLAGFCVYMSVTAPLHAALDSLNAPGLTGIGSAVVGGLLFLWTPYVLLGRRLAWRRLVPTAAISSAAVLVFGVGSVIFMPGIVNHDAERLWLHRRRLRHGHVAVRPRRGDHRRGRAGRPGRPVAPGPARGRRFIRTG
jgi:membrane protein